VGSGALEKLVGTDPLVEVHSVRTALRRTPRGGTTTDLVVEVLQKRTGDLDPQQQKAADAGENVGPGDFTYRAGSTLIVDDKMNARRVVRTAGNILDDLQMEAQRSFRRAHGARPLNEFRSAGLIQREPFAVLHRGGEG